MRSLLWLLTSILKEATLLLQAVVHSLRYELEIAFPHGLLARFRALTTFRKLAGG
ncbi:hypothetical protein [Chryseobacterium piperi]|uniref:hypothetical protein n=1 Tax=Chryseobacterium piperi TaxID=558152 RepID=UPI0012FE75AD|nr:hypothetical protein [Chryseobacterium piperi]